MYLPMFEPLLNCMLVFKVWELRCEKDYIDSSSDIFFIFMPMGCKRKNSDLSIYPVKSPFLADFFPYKIVNVLYGITSAYNHTKDIMVWNLMIAFTFFSDENNYYIDRWICIFLYSVSVVFSNSSNNFM